VFNILEMAVQILVVVVAEVIINMMELVQQAALV
jgi:hypothetical protein